MKISKQYLLGSLLLAATGISTHASANTERYEGLYVMAPGCTSVTLTAGIGLAVIKPDVDPGSISFDAIDQSKVQQLSLSCDDMTLDPAEVASFQQKTKELCMGFQIPWQTPERREEYCDDLAAGAVDAAQAMSAYLLRDLIESVDINILKDSWIGGFGEMDYIFTNGNTEHRGPWTFVSNSGKYTRGWASEGDIPNPLGCPSQLLAQMRANIDLATAFGGGARIYLDTNIADGVVCPVADLFNSQLLLAAYGFNINIKQQGDRQ